MMRCPRHPKRPVVVLMSVENYEKYQEELFVEQYHAWKEEKERYGKSSIVFNGETWVKS